MQRIKMPGIAVDFLTSSISRQKWVLGRLPDLQIPKHGHTTQSEVITIFGGMGISRER
jgi:hypothetical protein